MRLGIVGSRTFVDYDVALYWFVRVRDMEGYVDEIISGGAKGADALGARLARGHNIQLVEHLPDWGKYGNRAGMMRNKKIVDESDFILAFWDGRSPGTDDTIDEARLSKKPTLIIYI